MFGFSRFPMQLTLDFSNFLAAAAEGPLTVGWYLFLHGGWAIALVVVVRQLWRARQVNIEHAYLHRMKYQLLAIDVPRLNEQSTKAVEQIFAQLAGAEDKATLWEQYVHGVNQESFSLELVSLGGYIQFLVHTPAHFRDLIEASVYAQYPDAEITEVDDYTDRIPHKFPNEEYDLWGTELRLVKPNHYPIRTYPHFEHTLTQKFADPMAALLEILGHMGPDEQVWIQWVLTPLHDVHWKEEGMHEVKKLIGARVAHTKSLMSRYVNDPLNALYGGTGEILLHGMGITPIHAEAHAEPDAPPSLMQHLSPGERTTVEALEAKIAKVGFHVKGRVIYAAKKEKFSKPRGVSGVFGSLLQFNDQSLNGFAPNKKVTTKAKYFFTKRRVAARQRKIVSAYRQRSKHLGYGHGMILNTEELATVWHFPVMDVKAPSVKMTEAKRGEPPVELPMAPEELEAVVGPVQTEGAHAAPPSENLPV